MSFSYDFIKFVREITKHYKYLLKNEIPRWKHHNTRGLVHLCKLSNIFLRDIFHTALFWVLGEVDVGFVFVVVLNVFEVDDHVQGVGQDQQQDEGSDEAHHDGRCQEGGAAARRRKLTRGDVERLDLRKKREREK